MLGSNKTKRQSKKSARRGRRKKRKRLVLSSSVPMLPPGFKKDSRTWLHKNPKSRTQDVDKTAVLKRFLDSDRGEEFNENSPSYFQEFQGRAYKKDSRSWLHKSSVKKQQPLRARRVCANPVAGDCLREPEFARSNTDVRLSFQQDKLMKRKCATFHSSDGDIISNDYGLRQVLRKKRVDPSLHACSQMRRPHRTLSEERLSDDVNTIMTYAGLANFGQESEPERVREVTTDENSGCLVPEDEENCNHRRQSQCMLGYPAQAYPSLLTCDLWRDTAGVKSDTSSSEHSKGSMDTLAPGCEDLYNANDKGERVPSMELVNVVTDKLRNIQSHSRRSSITSLCDEHAQLKMMSMCASPPASPCSAQSISAEDLKSSDVDI